MAEPTVTEQQQQAQSSVEIERGQRGGIGWTIKKYTGSPLPDIEEIALYDDALKVRFLAKPEDLETQLERSIASMGFQQAGTQK